MTESARLALEHLRDPSQLQWYVIPLFSFVVYVYANEIERRNWNLVFDMKKIKTKVIVVGSIFAFDLLCIIIFGVILKWI